MLILAALGTASSSLGTGCRGDESAVPAPMCDEETGQSAQAIIGGQIDSDDPAVVAVNTLAVECLRGGAPMCTGALVRPDVVLTAAHCVREMEASSIAVVFGANADLGRGPPGDGLDGRFFRVKAVRLHPKFQPDGLANDMAVLELETAAATTPLPIARDFSDATSGPSARARAVGFGVADKRESGTSGGRLKRSGSVSMTSVGDLDFRYGADPAMTCDGDSGGPILRMRDDGGGEEIIGVTSRGDTSCREYGIAMRVDALPTDFIERKVP